MSPAHFSFNAKGSYPECRRRGFLEVELSFLDDVRLDCKVCEGRRYRDDVPKMTGRIPDFPEQCVGKDGL